MNSDKIVNFTIGPHPPSLTMAVWGYHKIQNGYNKKEGLAMLFIHVPLFRPLSYGGRTKNCDVVRSTAVHWQYSTKSSLRSPFVSIYDAYCSSSFIQSPLES